MSALGSFCNELWFDGGDWVIFAWASLTLLLYDEIVFKGRLGMLILITIVTILPNYAQNDSAGASHRINQDTSILKKWKRKFLMR